MILINITGDFEFIVPGKAAKKYPELVAEICDSLESRGLIVSQQPIMTTSGGYLYVLVMKNEEDGE